MPLALQVARFLSPAIAVAAIWRALAGIFREELRVLRMRGLRDHVVVCGLGRKASVLLRDFHREGARVVAIDPTMDSRFAGVCAEINAFVLKDDATRPGCLAAARVWAARHLIVATGDDSTNIEIVSSALNLVRRRGPRDRRRKIGCHIHIVDRQTVDLFRQHRLFSETAASVDLRVFNMYDNAARLLWRRHLLARGPLAPSDSRRMHVVVGGLNSMGEAVGLRIALSAHYANGRRAAVTVVDRNVDAAAERLLSSHPMLQRICDVRFVSGDLNVPATIRQIGEALSQPDDIGTVVLCLDRDHENLSTALCMASVLGPDGPPIFVRLALTEALAELLSAERSNAALARQVEGFGLVEECCAKETIVADKLFASARMFHAAYVRGRRAAGSQGDSPSEKPWEELDEDFRESNCEAAEHMEVKLRTFGYSSFGPAVGLPTAFDEAQAKILARMEHARWCAHRWLSGWTYAPETDRLRRRRSSLVPWEDLPDATRQTDRKAVHEIPVIFRILSAGSAVSPPRSR